MGSLRTPEPAGLDLRPAIAEYLHREFEDERSAPPSILRRTVEAGELGMTSGRGFHAWPSTSS
jgi:3-hydroxybutyryl-CoA dehydrogenase